MSLVYLFPSGSLATSLGGTDNGLFSIDGGTGIISRTGTLTAGTTYNVAYLVLDTATGLISGRKDTITAGANVLTISGTPDAAYVGSAYTFTPIVQYAVGSVSFSLTGTLPSGLSFSSATGAITGTPTAAGTTSGLSITATDAGNGATATLSFSLTVAATRYRAAVQSVPDVRAIYPLGETSGTTFSDVSGKGAPAATIVGGVTPGQAGMVPTETSTSALFNGTSGYCTIGSASTFNFEFNQPLTITAVIYPTAMGGDGQEQFIFCKELNGGSYGGWGFALINRGGALLLEFLAVANDGSFAQIYAIGSQSLSLNTAHLVQVSYDGSGSVQGVNFWVDGLPDINVNPYVDNLGGKSILSSAVPQIGARSGGGLFTGKIQYVSVIGNGDPNGLKGTGQGYGFNRSYDQLQPYLYNFGMQGRSRPADITVPSVIITTDLHEDVDDVFDIHIMCLAHKAGRANLIGVVTDSSDNYSASAGRAVLNYHGLTSVPVCAYQGNATPSGSPYTQQLATRFVDGVTRSSYTDDVTGLRALLNANSNVVILALGYAVSLARLLASPANANGDGLPTGASLIASKVKALVIASGFATENTGYGAVEYNIQQDAANYSTLATSWPTQIVQCGIELAMGASYTAPAWRIAVKPPATLDPTISPIKYAYDLFAGLTPSQLDANGRRGLYSGLGMLWIIEGATPGRVMWGGIGGTMTINASTGANSWSPVAPASGVPPWHFLRKGDSDANIQAWGDAQLATTP